MSLHLKKKIEASGISIKEIAGHCEKTPQTFSNYLNGSQSPTLKVLELIAEKIKCNSMELIPAPKGYDHVYTSQGIWMGIERIF